MPMAGIDPEAPDPGLPDDGSARRADRAKARPNPRFRDIEVALHLREGEAGIGDDRLGPRERRGRVIAGDLGRAGDAHALADRDDAEQLAVVDDRYAGRAIPTLALEGDRDALHRIDRHADTVLREHG